MVRMEQGSPKVLGSFFPLSKTTLPLVRVKVGEQLICNLSVAAALIGCSYLGDQGIEKELN